MKHNTRIFVLIGLMVLIAVQVSGETKKLRDVGRYRFLPLQAGQPAPEMMKAVADKYADDIRLGFETAGAPELYAPFLDKLRQGAMTERELPVGTPLIWMIFRSQGQIKVVRDLEWAGRAPLPVCAFTVEAGDSRYELVIPKACGNISLEKVEAAPAAEQPAPRPAAPPKEEERFQISRAKIYQEIADLINDTDLYCSFAMWEKPLPELRIIGAEREKEEDMFSDGDTVFLSKGKDAGIEPGQLFWVLEIRHLLPGYGPVAFGKARARIQFAYADKAAAVIENACHGVRLGYYLVPFEPREGMMGKDLGYNVPPVETEGARGSLLYLQSDLRQVATFMWALIDIGADKGLQVGQQLILYKRLRQDLPPVITGNCVVIDVKSTTATIKLLSCRDVLRQGDRVMERPR